MTPYIIILVAAVIGGYLHGVGGFFVWGAIAFGGTLLIGLVLRKASGGILPKQIRIQTAEEFVSERSRLVCVAWPSHSTPQQTKEIQKLLEAMYRRALTESKSFDLNAPADLDHFVASANLVAKEQDSEETQAVARELVNYLVAHPLWYGQTRNT